jgi:RecB family exonuclease
METLAAHPEQKELYSWACRERKERCDALQMSVRILRQRADRETPGPYAGNLSSLSAEFARRFGSGEHVWSASRLEAYRSCPFRFFVGSVLGLEPRPEPQEGLDARQLGSIYHRILELVYQDATVQNPAQLEQVLAALPQVAKRLLDEAPQKEGFRETAWWMFTRQEIEQNIRRSLEALAESSAEQGFVPIVYEQGFFEPHELRVGTGDEHFRLHGVIDRVDRTPDGRLRIIDYKTAGPTGYSNEALAEGKKIQIPLYALAAQALDLGELCDGFYWHVRHAKPSGFSLRRYQEKYGQDPLDVAMEKAWEAVRGVQVANFCPCVPSDGCPNYCPAVGFCWLYHPGFGG